jgi:hypothetical protein
MTVLTKSAGLADQACRSGTGPEGAVMAGKAVISLSTGLDDPEKVTVAFLVAGGATTFSY